MLLLRGWVSIKRRKQPNACHTDVQGKISTYSSWRKTNHSFLITTWNDLLFGIIPNSLCSDYVWLNFNEEIILICKKKEIKCSFGRKESLNFQLSLILCLFCTDFCFVVIVVKSCNAHAAFGLKRNYSIYRLWKLLEKANVESFFLSIMTSS